MEKGKREELNEMQGDRVKSNSRIRGSVSTAHPSAGYAAVWKLTLLVHAIRGEWEQTNDICRKWLCSFGSLPAPAIEYILPS